VNYDATIRELTEKRDFYDAAIGALKKIAVHDTAKAVAEPRKPERKQRKPLSDDVKARMAEAQRQRWARTREADGNVSQPHTDAIQ
jgi:hypothetical protein